MTYKGGYCVLMFKKKKKKVKIQTIKCKKYISKRYFTMVIINDPTKKARTVQLPKWIKLPLILSIFLLIGSMIYSVGYIAKLELSTANTFASYQTIKSKEKNYQKKIAKLEEANKKKDEQLKVVESTTAAMKTKLDSIDKDQKKLVEKLGGKVIASKNDGKNQLVLDETVHSLADKKSNVRYEAQPRQILSDGDEFDMQIQQITENLNVMSSKIEKEKEDIAKIDKRGAELIEYSSKYPMGWPTVRARITCPFGSRVNPITRLGTEMHTGVDIGVNHVSVKSVAKGRVVFAGWGGAWGYLVKVDHGNGMLTLYAHNSSVKVRLGDIVHRGTVIAISGNTGRSTGPHLHYQIEVNNKPVNPRPYMD